MEQKIIQVKENILEENSTRAATLRKILKEKNIFFINVMASPGAGKTTLLINLINKLKNEFNIGVMEADIDGDVDAYRITDQTGVKSIQIHTSGACHLTAQMTHDAINEFDIDGLDLLFLENVGNLVCPAEFDTGSNINMMLLSCPEGHDKPLKYPLMFEVSKIAVITKIETASIFDFDLEECKKNILKRNKDAKIFVTSALKDLGVDELANYIKELVKNNK
ncbi:MAG: hydrogenase nickel incorporation protein HypB [Bacilli bacterium]|nr:hydrogenase nickel incorporation protein HypB [Bacilli bacterium]MBR1582042.1 hydrogenase nickel incorporation protein HypB [Bacilli bacterium]